MAERRPGAAPADGTPHPAAIDGALALAAPRLDPVARRVAVATYRTLAGGRPAPAARIAATAGVEERVVGDLLDAWGAVFLDGRGDVVGFWGLAVAGLPHRLRAGGRDLCAWCAWDPLFLARIIGPLTVATDDPETGEIVTYRLDGAGAVHDLSHPRSMLSFLGPDGEWDDQVMATFCQHVLHFTGPETAQRWVDRHPGTFTLDLDTAVDLAGRHAERTFGEALR